jgi:hypothetical protein
MIDLGRRSRSALLNRLTLNFTQTSPMSKIKHSRRFFTGYSSLIIFPFTFIINVIFFLIDRISCSPPHQLACFLLQRIHPIFLHIPRAGRHITATCCCYFPTRTRLRSSRFLPGRSNEMRSMYEASCKSTDSGRMAEAHLCGEQYGMRKAQEYGGTLSVSILYAFDTRVRYWSNSLCRNTRASVRVPAEA